MTKATKKIAISKQFHGMLAINHHLNDIIGRGEPNIFIIFMI